MSKNPKFFPFQSEGSDVTHLVMFLWFSLLLFLLAELAVRRLFLLTEGDPHESRVPEALWTEKINTVHVICSCYKNMSIVITMVNKNPIKDDIISTRMLIILEFKPQGLTVRNIHFNKLKKKYLYKLWCASDLIYVSHYHISIWYDINFNINHFKRSLVWTQQRCQNELRLTYLMLSNGELVHD